MSSASEKKICPSSSKDHENELCVHPGDLNNQGRNGDQADVTDNIVEPQNLVDDATANIPPQLREIWRWRLIGVTEQWTQKGQPQKSNSNSANFSIAWRLLLPYAAILLSRRMHYP